MSTTREERGRADIPLSRAVWKKSSFSGGNGSCVEVADLGQLMAVRHSKNSDGPKLIVTLDAWRAFLSDVKAGSYDL